MTPADSGFESPPSQTGTPASETPASICARDELVELLAGSSDDHDVALWLYRNGYLVRDLIDAVSKLDEVDNSSKDFVILPVPHPFTTALEAALDAVLPLTFSATPETRSASEAT